MLLNWLDFYHWVNSGEGPERPEDEVYNDNDELDMYVDTWISQKKAEARDNKNSASGNKKKSWEC